MLQTIDLDCNVSKYIIHVCYSHERRHAQMYIVCVLLYKAEFNLGS